MFTLIFGVIIGGLAVFIVGAYFVVRELEKLWRQ